MNTKRVVIGAVLVVWVIATVLAQHPDDNNSRVRRLARHLGSFWIPNWKFFAPNPGIDDYILYYRTGDSGSDTWNEWRRLFQVKEPQFWEMFYSPTSRRDKGVLDIVTTLEIMGDSDAFGAAREAYCNLLVDFVRVNMAPTGEPFFQAMVVRGAGHETSIPPAYEIVLDPRPVQFSEEVHRD
ncbi:hypothetical protein [Mycetocola lacteus]|uniref:hypothetical protein n=1 Tax=Mycetocola lacteus TaxID=76637 RepID=UPI0011C47501|nr:hypothetical protein [Mycetocola lacteus]